MPFTSALVAQQTGDQDWKLVEPLSYEGNRDQFIVPMHAETDFASVPGAFQWLIPRSGRYTKAAVLHDYLWRHIDEVGISRSDADGIFRRVMRELDVPFLRRWMMWAAVRIVSLSKSHLHDRPGDIPRLVLLLLVPGLLVLAGGAIVFVFLFAFFLLELVTAGILWILRRTGAIRERTKPVNRPKVRWTA